MANIENIETMLTSMLKSIDVFGSDCYIMQSTNNIYHRITVEYNLFNLNEGINRKQDDFTVHKTAYHLTTYSTYFTIKCENDDKCLTFDFNKHHCTKSKHILSLTKSIMVAIEDYTKQPLPNAWWEIIDYITNYKSILNAQYGPLS